MNKELKDAIKDLDFLNQELEQFKNYLINKPSVTIDKETSIFLEKIKIENHELKQKLSDHKKFITDLLDRLESLSLAIKELKENE